jgi:hypothetical protein
LGALPETFDVVRSHRLVLSGGAREIPAVQDQIVADHLVDLLFDGQSTTWSTTSRAFQARQGDWLAQ